MFRITGTVSLYSFLERIVFHEYRLSVYNAGRLARNQALKNFTVDPELNSSNIFLPILKRVTRRYCSLLLALLTMGRSIVKPSVSRIDTVAIFLDTVFSAVLSPQRTWWGDCQEPRMRLDDKIQSVLFLDFPRPP